jgi:hypothetical protein
MLDLGHVPLAGMPQASGGPGGQLCAWLARLRDFSPFAFASPALEQKYQDYQSDHVGSHVGTMCWLLAVTWAALRIFAWHQSVDYPRSWLFTLPLALCIGIGFFNSFAPVTFRRHWQACSFAIIVTHVLMDDEMHTFMLAHRTASGRLHPGTLFELELYRLLSFGFFATGTPLSLPAWGVVQAILFLTPGLSLPGKCERFRGSEREFIPWPVFGALRSLVIAYSGSGPRVSEPASCQVCIIFWRVQIEMMGAVFRVWRDVAWRRAFLRVHTQLIGPNGVARAAAWPFGSPRTIVTCAAIIVCLVAVDVTAVDFWVWAIARSGWGTMRFL